MSKLADRIRKASRQEPAPIGFGAAVARPKTATMLVVARLGSSDASKAAEALEKGADVVLLEGGDAGKVKDAGGKASGCIIGVKSSQADRKGVAALREAGADFAVVDLDATPADAMLEENIGYVLAHNGGGEDTDLRLLGELGLDAIIIPAPPERLNLAELLKVRRLAALMRAPLLTPAKHDADAGYLQALRDSGVAGVIVDGSNTGRIKDLKATIESLPARGRKREERAEAVLPAAGPHAGHDDEEDDD